MDDLKVLKANISACSICVKSLPLGPRPVIQISQRSRILIAGQAPGKKVHQSGIPFDDPSGDRLRQWLGVDKHSFYDANKFAILPMGFCYPGSGKSGDLPPRTECIDTWREQVLSSLKNIELTLVIGKYAMSYHLPKADKTLTNVVRNWQQYWPNIVPLPHPSPRNNIWLKRNPWFEQDLLPSLKEKVSQTIARQD